MTKALIKTYAKYNQPDCSHYHLATDPITKQKTKFYLNVREDEFDQKVPSYYRYLYKWNRGFYQLEDNVFYKRTTDHERSAPPKDMYKQMNTGFIKNRGPIYHDKKKV